MVNGLGLCSTRLTSGHSKRFTLLPDTHPFMHTLTHTRGAVTTDAGQAGSGDTSMLGGETGIEPATLTGQPANQPTRSAD